MPGFPNTSRYLRDLAERLMRVPVLYGTDQSDCDELSAIAQMLDELPMSVVQGWVEPALIHDA